jgi:hypothetical protein
MLMSETAGLRLQTHLIGLNRLRERKRIYDLRDWSRVDRRHNLKFDIKVSD